MRRKLIEKISDKKGAISVIELFAIIAIIVMVAFVSFIFLRNRNQERKHGTDALDINTAESIAKTNSLNGASCPVNDCGGGDCEHKVLNYYVGYYDNVNNKIVGNLVSGYNKTDNPYVGDTRYKGDAGTLILRIRTGDGTIQIDWVNPSTANR